IADDYWLDRAWLDVQTADGASRVFPLPFERGGFDAAQAEQWKLKDGDNVHHWIDLRDQRTRADSPFVLKPGDKISITVYAADRCDLDGFHPKDNPHVGVGDRVQLDVVTPDDLIVILERRELELRRRLEQVVEETTQMRDSLARVRSDFVAGDSPADGAASVEGAAVEPGDKPQSPEEQARRADALRKLHVQRSVNQSEKSRGETQGVGLNLLDVVEQIENNRLDTEDRKERLQNQVAGPLLALAEVDFVELDKRLAELNRQVASAELDRPAAQAAAEAAIAQNDQILLKLDGVLQKMLDIESFNEIIEYVRALLEEQDEVIGETKTLRKNQLFGLE
ncbi:MAG: hypothetical protein KDA41_05315, partial [Planctomycetales bacterium]|nr:hypothetical protein [Planctomycetales bacterium]